MGIHKTSSNAHLGLLRRLFNSADCSTAFCSAVVVRDTRVRGNKLEEFCSVVGLEEGDESGLLCGRSLLSLLLVLVFDCRRLAEDIDRP